jgi:hypothetical protein
MKQKPVSDFKARFTDAVDVIKFKCPDQWDFILKWMLEETLIPLHGYKENVPDNIYMRQVMLKLGIKKIYDALKAAEAEIEQEE